MGAPTMLPDLPETDPPLSLAILRRSDGQCEVGARGCDLARTRIGFLHVDDDLPVNDGTVLHACRPCAARCVDDPALARRLSGVPA